MDILIIDAGGYPAAAIEYQGGGHYRGNAAARDAVKGEALRRAGVPMVEVFEGDAPEEILRQLRGALGWAEIRPAASAP
jgi:hypothetical protein